MTAKSWTGRTTGGLQVLRDMCNLTAETTRSFGSGSLNSTSHLGYVVQWRFPLGSRPSTSKVSLDAATGEGVTSDHEEDRGHGGGHHLWVVIIRLSR